MSKRKTERLLGLVVCLLSTRRYLTAEQVRAAVSGYPEQDDLFKRMFERMVDTGLQRHAELAEILLIPLEHPLEQVVLFGVARHGRADLLGGEVAPGLSLIHI